MEIIEKEDGITEYILNSEEMRMLERFHSRKVEVITYVLEDKIFC